MKKLTIILFLFAAALVLSSCTASKGVTQSASGKNLDLDGYLSYGKIEAANNETATPQGVLIIGRVTYKSRKVSIPADQKVPNTGNFKAVRTKSLFGSEEEIIEYDWTAGSDKDAEIAENKLQEMKEKLLAEKKEKEPDKEQPDKTEK